MSKYDKNPMDQHETGNFLTRLSAETRRFIGGAVATVAVSSLALGIMAEGSNGGSGDTGGDSSSTGGVSGGGSETPVPRITPPESSSPNPCKDTHIGALGTAWGVAISLDPMDIPKVLSGDKVAWNCIKSLVGDTTGKAVATGVDDDAMTKTAALNEAGKITTMTASELHIPADTKADQTYKTGYTNSATIWIETPAALDSTPSTSPSIQAFEPVPAPHLLPFA